MEDVTKNYEDALIQKQVKKDARLERQVKAAKFISLGNGNPFEIINTCTASDYTKHQLRHELIHGNEGVMRKFEKYREMHQIDVAVHADTFDFAVSGDFVDVGRYMGGEPECMVDFSCVRETQFVDFYINIDVCAQVTSENAFAYYASALSVIDSLENSGYRVRLIGVNYSDNVKRGEVLEVTIIIKEYNEPINYAYLTSICMAQTSFFNAVMYRPGYNLYNYAGCDYLPGFEPNVTSNDNTFYAPSLFGRNREGVIYSHLNKTPGAFSFDSLTKDWQLDHLLAK